ncbi:RNA polymerase subunit sigma [Streptomyces sp. NBC_01092]|uniref:RNA polymerase subunit sigma n=1 Tax=Streptomyces sp. NBC_01092 TaxID=2903748 RepID=UPI00386C3621|nr:RNA polymerase subunit sigma [Streptomyces sp. NBC_01092]
MAGADDAVSLVELLDERRHLVDVAFWMLGREREAERVIDEAYRQWFGLSDAERARIVDPRSWLARVVGGICLSRLASPGRDRARVTSDAGDAVGRGVLAEEVSGVLLEALDSLPPAERAAFVLNDVFACAPGAVADILRQSEPVCVELADRARKSLRAQRRLPTSVAEHDAVVGAVRAACVSEDEGVLASLLAVDATAFFDGGGKVRALVKPVHGGAQVARTLLTLLARHPRTTLDTHAVNGRTGLVVQYGRQVAAVISLDVAGPHVVQVWVTVNPDKLRTWNHAGGLL